MENRAAAYSANLWILMEILQSVKPLLMVQKGHGSFYMAPVNGVASLVEARICQLRREKGWCLALHKAVAEQLELINYLHKHADEIIDYDRRKKAGKTIGSGLVEKACDQVVGYRQKNKGMSWSSLGSKSLAILKVVLLNNEWGQIWFPETTANDASFDQAANDFDGGNVVPLFQVVNL